MVFTRKLPGWQGAKGQEPHAGHRPLLGNFAITLEELLQNPRYPASSPHGASSPIHLLEPQFQHVENHQQNAARSLSD